MVRWMIPVTALALMVGIFVWAWNYNKPEPAGAGQLPAAVVAPIEFNALGDQGPYSIQGTAIMDTTSGLPAVPFIMFKDVDGRTWTKQLVYADMRGCLPNAGDMPCVPTYPQESAYPDLATGMSITVTGYIREERFLVTGLEVGG